MIKSIFNVAICLFFFTTTSYAQTSEGNIMLGGHFNSDISKQEKLFIIDVAPFFGVFVKENIAVGGNVGFRLARYGATNKHISLGILPSVRYFFGKQSHGRLFLQGEAGYHRVNNSVGDIFIARSGLGAGVGAGFAYFFNQSVSIEGLYRVRGFRYTDKSSSFQNNLLFGVQLYIPSYRIR